MAAAYARLAGSAGPPTPLCLCNARFLHLIPVDAGAEPLDFQVATEPGAPGTGLTASVAAKQLNRRCPAEE